ncbi:hypothetical protein EYF80_048831 [Liparis tanakae]|uniref:Uncharacterized protein n=1 Tax=Liparis tanakae TaxID=230148 RepID=A0A4Z2FJ50_9TELE|nr:hypothetical protein EYF80_048831 [Liparis tanakae]
MYRRSLNAARPGPTARTARRSGSIGPSELPLNTRSSSASWNKYVTDQSFICPPQTSHYSVQLMRSVRRLQRCHCDTGPVPLWWWSGPESEVH